MTDRQESLEDALENRVGLYEAYRILEHFVAAVESTRIVLARSDRSPDLHQMRDR